MTQVLFLCHQNRQKRNIEIPYQNQKRTAEMGTNHNVTTFDKKIKLRKPFLTFEQNLTLRGIGLRGPGGQFVEPKIWFQQRVLRRWSMQQTITN